MCYVQSVSNVNKMSNPCDFVHDESIYDENSDESDSEIDDVDKYATYKPDETSR